MKHADALAYTIGNRYPVTALRSRRFPAGRSGQRDVRDGRVLESGKEIIIASRRRKQAQDDPDQNRLLYTRDFIALHP